MTRPERKEKPMKPIKSILSIVSILGLFIILVPQVYATGGPAETDPCCLSINPGGGALAMKGTLALVYDPASFNVDVTLRLERSGTQEFFRLNFQQNLIGLTDNTILCYIFNPNETNDPAIKGPVFTFVQEILNRFFSGRTPYNTRLVITPSSASDYQGIFFCDITGDSLGNCEIGDTGRVSTLGDITVFAVDADKANLANPTCP
jgi:hypothetical protein